MDNLKQILIRIKSLNIVEEMNRLLYFIAEANGDRLAHGLDSIFVIDLQTRNEGKLEETYKQILNSETIVYAVISEDWLDEAIIQTLRKSGKQFIIIVFSDHNLYKPLTLNLKYCTEENAIEDAIYIVQKAYHDAKIYDVIIDKNKNDEEVFIKGKEEYMKLRGTC